MDSIQLKLLAIIYSPTVLDSYIHFYIKETIFQIASVVSKCGPGSTCIRITWMIIKSRFLESIPSHLSHNWESAFQSGVLYHTMKFENHGFRQVTLNQGKLNISKMNKDKQDKEEDPMGSQKSYLGNTMHLYRRKKTASSSLCLKQLDTDRKKMI